MTILLIAHNNKKYVELVLDSIRMYGDMENNSVIVIDNASDDGLGEAMQSYNGITYVYMDEGWVTPGTALNMVIKELDVDEEILVMGPYYMITPGCLTNMERVMHSQPDIGVVGTMANVGGLYQIDDKYSSYEAMISSTKEVNYPESKRVLSIVYGPVLMKKSNLEDVGLFDEAYEDLEYVLKDYCVVITEKNKKVMVCYDSYSWSIPHAAYKIKMHDFKALENKWNVHYMVGIYNERTIAMIEEPSDAEFNVLEVGCDCGATLLEIKNRYKNSRIYGTDINPASARLASYVAEAKYNDIEAKDLDFGGVKFKYIIFGDVLEHLRDPKGAVEYCKEHLTEDGCIIACIPNVMHISIVHDLIVNGNFTYQEAGLLDKTHIHLFTYNEIIKMFEQAGYTIDTIKGTQVELSKEQTKFLDDVISISSENKRELYLVYQFVVRARKNN